MSFSTAKGLDAILTLLEKNDLKPAVRATAGKRRFAGTNGADLFVGDEQNNIATGLGRDDILRGNDGDDRLNGDKGNDVLLGGNGNDLVAGGNNRDALFGDAGTDSLDGGNGNDLLDGGVEADSLLGGTGNDMLVGGDGVDTLVGGIGNDQFIYNGNPFANGTPALAGQTGINVLNQPDIISDYTIGQDQFVFDSNDLGIRSLTFQKGQSGQIADGNAIVLLDPFIAAGAAARAIANNANVVADEGVFVYFNTTLGLTRVVYSEDLGDGGNISVLANLDNQRGPIGQANIANFAATDFSLV